ncbi:DUF1629 domain-containing protein [Hyphomicrobium sp. D-2]|uniref:imm11 family protein n=1 Tax=Hyphomicrobium sp. D-2 TaxID=3041621 RepID=UPI002455843D|nr:DUF1629 domain-containing protein [Hyphomicrobium sp. D-2]MDH4981593.1 hypothetical protein [Hyphomicrobium sp. D-2]
MAWQLDFSSEFATPSIEFINPPDNYFVLGMSVGFPVNPGAVPTSGRLEEPWEKPFVDVFPMPGLNAVSERFKNLVEQFEPGMHQFFPFMIEHRDGTLIDEKLYIFNCAVGVDAIIFRKHQPVWQTYEFDPPTLFAGMLEKFELSCPAIGEHHIWCGETVAPRSLFVSDAFYSAVKHNKIRGLRGRHREELDDPWTEAEIAPLIEWNSKRH